MNPRLHLLVRVMRQRREVALISTDDREFVLETLKPTLEQLGCEVQIQVSPAEETMTELTSSKALESRRKLDSQAQQYVDHRPHIVLNQLNELGTSWRGERDRMQRELMNLKLRNSVLVRVAEVVAAVLLARAPEIFEFLVRLLN